MKIKTTTEYILEEKDITTIKHCLNYCAHRAEDHGKRKAGNILEINRLRQEFGIIKDYQIITNLAYEKRNSSYSR